MQRVIVYTVHKAGSTFVNLLMRQACRRYSIPHYTTNKNECFDAIAGSSWKEFIEQTQGPAGFGPVRGVSKWGPVFPDNLQDYSVVLHLRDPRDVLTSLFYSNSYSHCIRPGRFEATEQQRNEWIRKGIDHYVLETAPTLQSTYKTLCANLLNKPNVVAVHYEEMVLSYESWLPQFLTAFNGFQVRARKKRHLILPQYIRRKKIESELYQTHKRSFHVDQEDIYNHKRKVTPGDHKEKLADSTIEQLNAIFADYFNRFEHPARALAG